MNPPLFVGMVAACIAIACIARNEPLRRTGIVMLTAWAFFTLWRTVIEPDNQWPWMLYAAGDALAAWLILLPKAYRWQGWIGLCFLIQIAMNIGYGASYLQHGYSYEAQLLAWQVNSWIGDVKLLFMGGWAGACLVGLTGRLAGMFPHIAAGVDRSGGQG